ncbi:hypothetical protein PVAP13_9NG672712 [Panicum virgatum]|uniref:Uncharacterized protein n=1 Tax=Panicum virgatum TaxID=38727 RepID=A0A8T0N127_PANVG|nr:hypothetical protein PVAP13_9NG672712 [Panicum virgatum]
MRGRPPSPSLAPADRPTRHGSSSPRRGAAPSVRPPPLRARPASCSPARSHTPRVRGHGGPPASSSARRWRCRHGRALAPAWAGRVASPWAGWPRARRLLAGRPTAMLPPPMRARPRWGSLLEAMAEHLLLATVAQTWLSGGGAIRAGPSSLLPPTLLCGHGGSATWLRAAHNGSLLPPRSSKLPDPRRHAPPRGGSTRTAPSSLLSLASRGHGVRAELRSGGRQRAGVRASSCSPTPRAAALRRPSPAPSASEPGGRGHAGDLIRARGRGGGAGPPSPFSLVTAGVGAAWRRAARQAAKARV